MKNSSTIISHNTANREERKYVTFFSKLSNNRGGKVGGIGRKQRKLERELSLTVHI